jgi:hypothetical protein
MDERDARHVAEAVWKALQAGDWDAASGYLPESRDDQATGHFDWLARWWSPSPSPDWPWGRSAASSTAGASPSPW